MSHRARLVPVAVAALLVLAGCSGDPSPTATETDGQPTATGATPPTDTTRPSPTSTSRTETPTSNSEPPTSRTETPIRDVDDDETVPVEGDRFPVNATRVFGRVETLLGVDAREPTVRLHTDPTSDPVPLSAFERQVGLTRNGSVESWPVSGAGRTDAVALLFHDDVENASPALVELILVHEMVHTVQYQRGGGDLPLPGEPADYPARVVQALREGGAVYVTDVYARRYGIRYPGGRTPVAERAHRYRTRPAWVLDSTGSYYFGARYFDRRLDSPADIWTVYADPPTTMEQVVHGRSAGPARPLSVTVDAPAGTVRRQGRQGETDVRAVLRSGLSRETAAAAAAGWGNDALVRIDTADSTGFAWVLRWDDRAEADELEAGLETLVDRAATPGDLEVVRVAPETVVLLAGAAAFVDATTVTGTNESATVRHGG